jgi:dTDP-L-rhamnose 4-epimerase
VVVLYDSIEPPVHGGDAVGRPAYLDSAHRLVVGDIRDPDNLGPELRRADVVVHLAAMVGVGQSMYQVRRYTEVNTGGAANLLQLLVDDPGRARKLVVASSMSIYGEGAYACQNCGRVAPRLRAAEQLAEHDWEVRCPSCRSPLTPIATGEEKPLYPTSIYAINKRDHEEMFLAFGRAYGIPAVALRLFNIYGPRQALSNPYTGLAAIFASHMLRGLRPPVFEDGQQLRDFVHVGDVVQALALAIERPEADGEVFNIGTGRPISVLRVGELLAGQLGWDGGLELTSRYRAGDIRHCFANVTRARERLGYQPRVAFEEGVRELAAWVVEQQGRVGAVADATQQLADRGLVA